MTTNHFTGTFALTAYSNYAPLFPYRRVGRENHVPSSRFACTYVIKCLANGRVTSACRPTSCRAGRRTSTS